MTRSAQERARWVVVVVFAAGMAWVESACVYYLRILVNRVEPYQPFPLPFAGALGSIELVREAATLVMLLTVGMLAGRTKYARLAYAAIAFGAWDILYYVFLWIMCGWPRSLFDWDILFLLPLPWWGPVLAPCCIATLMIVWGTRVTQGTGRAAVHDVTRLQIFSAAAGIALALYVFMTDALRAIHDGQNVALVLPQAFNWWLFCAALALMAAPLAARRPGVYAPARRPAKSRPTFRTAGPAC